MSSESDGKSRRPDTQPPTVEFRPVYLPNHSTPPKPVRGTDYGPRAANNSRERPGELFKGLVNNSVKARDAVRLGWIVRSPARFQFHAEPVSHNETSGPIESSHPRITVDDRVSSFVSPGPSRPDTLRIDTHWDVRIPSGTVLLALPLLNHHPGGVRAIPTVIQETEPIDEDTPENSERDFTRVEPCVEVQDGAILQPGEPFAQLVLIRSPAPAVNSRAMTEDELSTVDKNERAMQIYADWYEQHRDPDRI